MDRTSPMDKHMEVMINRYGLAAAPAAPQMFGNAGKEHMEKYGAFLFLVDLAVIKTERSTVTWRNNVCFFLWCYFLSGTKPEHFAKIAWKNHKHSTNNP